MATLVLSTVGTALGGPIGGAIGSLVGQSIDQQLFGSASRGPRLGDLSVQTSSYGTQIPRIYGTMRVAGSVIWATDLVESAQTTGAKGQPDTIFSYAVSFAVALSSRPASEVRRIWADGKLLRGEDGEFKVSTQFRFYPGDESHAIDPLIGSVEGIDDTPAYRGLALAVFEGLELAEYGNRIPFLTFELVADDAPPQLRAVLADASGGMIDCDAADPVGGYAALGSSIRAATEPLVDFYSVELFDDGTTLRSAAAGPAVALEEGDFGNSADARPAPRTEREQAPSRTLPATVTLGYYDPQRDYQAGQARATSSERSGVEDRSDLPAVLSAGEARILAENLIARRWARREKLTLRLPPRFLGIEPGAIVDVPLSPSRWSVEQVTIDAMVAVADLRPAWRASPQMPADAGRALPDVDIPSAAVTLELVQLPDLDATSGRDPTVYLAASSADVRWRGIPVEVSTAGWTSGARTASRKAAIGLTGNGLSLGQPHLLDLTATIDVELTDPGRWLTSCDDDALVQGVNLAAIGDELIQFGDAMPLGPGQFRLSRLLRGRGGTEWATGLHVAGEMFVLIERDALQAVRLPAWTRGAPVIVTQIGTSGGATASASAIMSADPVRPFTPVHFKAAIDQSGDLQLGWTRRSRQGLAWIDEVDAPIGEASEAYEVAVAGVSGSIERQCSSPSLIVTAAELAGVGAGAAVISLRQMGDWAASRTVQTFVTLP